MNIAPDTEVDGVGAIEQLVPLDVETGVVGEGDQGRGSHGLDHTGQPVSGSRQPKLVPLNVTSACVQCKSMRTYPKFYTV